MKKTKKPIRCPLKNSITDKSLIKKYLHDNPKLANKQEADYILDVSATHLLYKYEDKKNICYVHYGPDEIFRICVYDKPAIK